MENIVYKTMKYNLKQNIHISAIYMYLLYLDLKQFSQIYSLKLMFNCYVFPILQHIIGHLEYNSSTAFIIIHI